ncbi:MAG: CHAT domain-containing protein [Actinomycetota bacterium]|nr:CHAT domain-containing protein [Actinomycetota bacterium]
MGQEDASFSVGSERYSIDTLVDIAQHVLSRLATNDWNTDIDSELSKLVASADDLAPVELGARLLHTLASDERIWVDVATPTIRSLLVQPTMSVPDVVGIVGVWGPVYAVSAKTGWALDDAAMALAYRPLAQAVPSDELASVDLPDLNPSSGDRSVGRERESEAQVGGVRGVLRRIFAGGGARGEAEHAGGGEPEAEVRGDGGGSPPTVAMSRFLRTELPERAPVDASVSLLVRVAMQPGDSSGSVDIDLVDIPPEGANLHIVVSAPGLQSLDQLEQDLLVPPDEDSAPVRFGLRTKTIGLQTVHVTAWRGGSFVGEIELQISVEANVGVEEGKPREVAIGMTSDPGEVTLQVRYDPTAREYMFQLLSNDRLFVPITERLSGPPDDDVDALARNLSDFAAKRTMMDPTVAQSWMREAGVGLWSTLVPEAIQEQFWELRDSVTAFTIASDKDVVPWELLYPLAEGKDEGFLVDQFPVMRRVYAQRRVHALALGGAKYVVPPNSPADAMDEVAAVQRRFGTAANAADVISSLGPLIEVLNAADFGVLHFACHNSFDVAHGGSSVKMDGGAFEPLRLNSAVVQHSFAARSPLVFFNACRSDGEVLEYTRLSGWASKFMAAGVGAFVGTLWSVRSSSAVVFADNFYGAFVEDRNLLGQAAKKARAAIKTPDDPTWLAYTIYGDPNATVLEGVS